MRRITGLFVGCLLSLCCFVSTSAADEAPPYFSRYVGQYPSVVLKNESDLSSRVRQTLGSNYALFKERMQTETPFEQVGAAIVATGCMQHNCSIEDAALIINLLDGKVTCVIHSTKWGGKSKYWDEDDASLPKAALQHALDAWN